MTSRFATWNDVVGPPTASCHNPDQGHPAPRDTLVTLDTKQLDSTLAGELRRVGGDNQVRGRMPRSPGSPVSGSPSR
jgi:hypothetical protein